MPSQERELWQAKLDLTQCKMESWPGDLYKFMIRRCNEFDDMEIRKRVRAHRRKRHGRYFNGPAPLQSAMTAASEVRRWADQPGKPARYYYDWKG
jgi:hypothetical protein